MSSTSISAPTGFAPALEEAAVLASSPVRHWPATLALAAIAGIYLLLSEAHLAGPRWLLPVVVVVLIPMAYIARSFDRDRLAHAAGVTVMVAITFSVGLSAALLLAGLTGQKIEAPVLLRDAALIWVANVLGFALWHWQIDGGGPARRHQSSLASTDFVFPQMTMDTPEGRTWKPQFVDYLFVAFNTSTAFSPTDTMVLSRRAKLLTMVQSLISLVVIAVLAARAINTL